MKNFFRQTNKKFCNRCILNERLNSIGHSSPLKFRRYKRVCVKGLSGKGKKAGCCIIPLITLVVITFALFLPMLRKGSGSGGSLIISGGNGPQTLDIIKITGEISDSSAGLKSSNYNHAFICSKIDELINDESSSALMLYIDTPGGDIYETDELYGKIMKYKTSGRPVYSYLAETAASGGYYIASASTEIFANRNCITGSIGVTMGTLLDFSGFLEKNGIKTYNLNAGRNKSMGSMLDSPTEEQIKIFQSVLDDAYNNFVEVVMHGRGLTLEETVKLADGRIYTANQALENKLIDQISDYGSALGKISQSYLSDAIIREYIPAQPSFAERLLTVKSDAFQPSISSELLNITKSCGSRAGYYMNMNVNR